MTSYCRIEQSYTFRFSYYFHPFIDMVNGAHSFHSNVAIPAYIHRHKFTEIAFRLAADSTQPVAHVTRSNRIFEPTVINLILFIAALDASIDVFIGLLTAKGCESLWYENERGCALRCSHFFFARDKSVEKWNYRLERVAVLSYLSIVQDTKLITSSGDPLEEKE